MDSGRMVAMETLLLGWIACVVVVEGCGLTATENRLGFIRFFVFVAAIVVLGIFSLPPAEAGMRGLAVPAFRGGTGDGGGRKLEILRSGNLTFEGANGGFFSVMVFSAACFRDENPEGWAVAAAKALVSCFSLVFLSSASWFSRSRTCWKSVTCLTSRINEKPDIDWCFR